jgi:hypothetical protein
MGHLRTRRARPPITPVEHLPFNYRQLRGADYQRD